MLSLETETKYKELFKDNLYLLNINFKILEKTFEIHLPEVYHHLVNYRIMANYYSPSWFLTIFACFTPIFEIKNMPKFTEEKKKELLGINYDFNKFIIFNVVQSLFYKEKIDRENENDKKMKIIDSNDEAEVDKFLKEKTKHIYSSKYAIENQKQIKLENEIIISSKNIIK